MERIVGGLAAGLGYLVRFILLILPTLLLAVGFGLVIFGIAGYDPRAACAVVGVFMNVMLWPKPKEKR